MIPIMVQLANPEIRKQEKSLSQENKVYLTRMQKLCKQVSITHYIPQPHQQMERKK